MKLCLRSLDAVWRLNTGIKVAYTEVMNEDLGRQHDPEMDNGALGGMYLPSIAFGPKIAHYYGDLVRRIFIGIGVAILIVAPFFASRSPVELPFEIFGAVVLVCLAALTSPKNKMIMTINAAAAGVGVVASEVMALYFFYAGDSLMFFLREMFAVAFLFALYFSVKTVRSMTLGQIGRRPMPGEFMGKPTRHSRTMTDSGD